MRGGRAPLPALLGPNAALLLFPPVEESAAGLQLPSFQAWGQPQWPGCEYWVTVIPTRPFLFILEVYGAPATHRLPGRPGGTGRSRPGGRVSRRGG